MIAFDIADEAARPRLYSSEREGWVESLDGSGRSRGNSNDGNLMMVKPNSNTASNSQQHDNPAATRSQPPPNQVPHSRDRSQLPLVPGAPRSYTFERYIARSILNTFGPALVTAFYLFIVCIYLLQPGVSDVVPTYPIDARGVFFAWLILSIFVLDWAKSGLAGFEASALMKRRLGPSHAMQLMWHTDRGWGSISGWWRALMEVWSLVVHKLTRKRHKHDWKGPLILWWYLALSSFLLYIAIPLAGLSMDPGDAYRLTGRPITILGANQTSFDGKLSNAVTVEASNRWRQGNPTSPQGDTIFYAPVGTKNVSSTYYEDCIQAIYQGNHTEECAANNSITLFSGPQVSERAHGTAWGLQMTLSCSIANPYTGLKLIDVQSINNWTASVPFSGLSGSSGDYDDFTTGLQEAGLSPVLFYKDTLTAVSYQCVMASDGDISSVGISSYVNASLLPLVGAVELVMWQGYSDLFNPDATFKNLSSHTSVVSSVSPFDNVTYLGYGIRCTVSSDFGFADLDAATRTYSNFIREPAAPFVETLGSLPETQYPGMQAIQALAFTSVNLGYLGSPLCLPGVSVGCNVWYGASLATGAAPFYAPTSQSNRTIGVIQYPTITPERMNLAMYKLFGEVAIAMMGSGSGSWTGGLKGLDPANTLIPGRIPWQIVLALLAVWTLITILPSMWAFPEKRWAATLDGFEMFRLGAEWRGVVRRFEGTEFKENEGVLLDVPGMIGDMEPDEKRGFVGLSYKTARLGRDYGYDRDDLS